MNGTPIIRIEVENMKQSIAHAFTEMQLSMDANVRNALEKFCTPENIERVVNQQVEDTIKEVIQREIDTFFKIGPGRSVINEEVRRKMSETYHL